MPEWCINDIDNKHWCIRR